MSTRKTERILNLTICLLVSGRYLPKSRIREAVEGYHDLSDAAFERTFERDKDELRSLGVPIEVGSFDAALRRRARLPDPGRASSSCRRSTWTPRRPSVVGVAARVWQHAEHGRVDPERAGQAAGGRRRAGHLPAGRAGAVGAGHRAGLRAAVERGAGAHPGQLHLPRRARRRTLEPWGMTASKGRWYVIGWDTDRKATRMFKLSRITDQPRRVSRPARTRCRPTSTCGRWPARWRPGSRPQPRCSPSGRARARRCADAASRRPAERTDAARAASRCSAVASPTC